MGGCTFNWLILGAIYSVHSTLWLVCLEEESASVMIATLFLHYSDTGSKVFFSLSVRIIHFFCFLYLHSWEHLFIIDFDCDATSSWRAPWIVMMSEVVFQYKLEDVAIVHFRCFLFYACLMFNSIFTICLMVSIFIGIIGHAKNSAKHTSIISL